MSDARTHECRLWKLSKQRFDCDKKSPPGAVSRPRGSRLLECRIVKDTDGVDDFGGGQVYLAMHKSGIIRDLLENSSPSCISGNGGDGRVVPTWICREPAISS
jgi:hypothetical protein